MADLTKTVAEKKPYALIFTEDMKYGSGIDSDALSETPGAITFATYKRLDQVQVDEAIPAGTTLIQLFIGSRQITVEPGENDRVLLKTQKATLSATTDLTVTMSSPIDAETLIFTVAGGVDQSDYVIRVTAPTEGGKVIVKQFTVAVRNDLL